MTLRRDGRYAAVLSLATLAFPGFSLAQSPPPPSAQELEARRTLLEQVREARAAGDHARALQLVERAGQIAMNSSIHRVAAQELAALGRIAEAYARANECLSTADREPPSGPRDVVLNDCRELAASLRTRIGRVVINVPSPAPDGIVVHIGGRVIPAALWGVPYPVDPGTVRVDASAPAWVGFRQDFAVAPGASVPVNITVAASAPTPEPTPAPVNPTPVTHEPAATPPPAHTEPVTPVTPPPEDTPQGRSPIGLVVGAAGVASLAVGIVLEVVASSNYNSLRSACTTGASPCDSAQNFDSTQAGITTMDNAALGTMVAGGVLIVAGGALYFLLHPAEHNGAATSSSAATNRPHVRLVPGIAGLSVQGTF